MYKLIRPITLLVSLCSGFLLTTSAYSEYPEGNVSENAVSEKDTPGKDTKNKPLAKITKPRSMTNQHLGELIHRLDENVEGRPGFWQLKVEGMVVNVITDKKADRMRIITPIEESDNLDKKILYRLMQSNFDSALDARYSIAKEILWGTFIHPLSSLGDEEFLSALGQVVNLAESYGTTYSSGALLFQGGDSEGIRRRDLINKLIEKGMSI